LKKHPPPHAISVQDFVTLYGLPKIDKNPHKLKIPLDLQETDLIDIFGPAKGKKGKAGYTYSECTNQEVVLQIL